MLDIYPNKFIRKSNFQKIIKMPEQNSSNKITIHCTSNPSYKLSPFNNNVSDVIGKFERSQKTQIQPEPAHAISHCAKLKNSTKNIRISVNSQNKQKHFLQSKQNSFVVNKNRMCELINSGAINGDLCDNNNHSEPIIESEEQLEINDLEFIPIDGGGVVTSRTRSKLMRLKNINLVRYQWNIFQRFIGISLSFPFFSSINGAGLSTLTCAFFLPQILCENILYPIFRLVLGTLYPAYASYKAVRNKDVKEYLKWIMYWIVFAFFTCCETFTDIFLSWFPFYYELKVVIVIWLLSPVTEGSSVLYRNFVHPMLTKREKEIDEYINQAKEKGCSAVIQLGSKGVNYATNVIMQTALKSHILLRLTSEESSFSRVRDQVDYPFEEINEIIMTEEEEEEAHFECQSEHSSRHDTPFNDTIASDSDDPDFVGEAIESFEEDNDSQTDEDDDDLDGAVKQERGRGRPPKSQATKMKKTKNVEPNTRSTRATRAASVRF